MSLAEHDAVSQWAAFHAFSLTHGAVIFAFAVVMSLIMRLARSQRDRAALVRRERLAAMAMLAAWILINAWGLMPARFDASDSLPLHVCDLVGLLAPLALWKPASWSRALVYFWGLGLCTQAFITPLLMHGPATLRFWTFWITHGIAVGTPLYDVAVRAYRPRWRDCAFACAAALGYAIIMFPVDSLAGWNYSYLGPDRPDRPTILDALGPWPWRACTVAALSGLAMIALMLPWTCVRALRRAR